jgi:hypothetical protein
MNQTYCPNCGTANEPSNNYCTNCGKALIVSESKPVLKWITLGFACLSLIAFFLPWISIGGAESLGIKISINGYEIPGWLDKTSQALNGNSNGSALAIWLYFLPVLSIAIGLGSALDVKIIKVISEFVFLSLIGVISYNLFQLSAESSKLLGIGFYLIIFTAVYFFFEFWISVFGDI